MFNQLVYCGKHYLGVGGARVYQVGVLSVEVQQDHIDGMEFGNMKL